MSIKKENHEVSGDSDIIWLKYNTQKEFLLLFDMRPTFITLQYQYCLVQRIIYSQTNWDCLKTLRYQYIQDIKGKYLKNKWFGLTNHLDKESPLPFGSCNLVVVVEPSKQYRNPLTSFSYSLLIPLPTFQPWVGSLPCAEKISTKGPPCNTIPHSIIKLSRQSTFIRKSNNVHVHLR